MAKRITLLFWVLSLFGHCVYGNNYTCPTKDSVIALQDVQDAARGSEEIYKSDLNTGTKIPGTQFTIIQIFHKKFKEDGEGIKVAIAVDGNTTMVVYRGTKGLEQLLMQAKSRVFDEKYELDINGTEVKILDFFHDAFKLSFEDIKPFLQDSTKKYILTGHSLGGALSSILALTMTQEHNGSIWQHPQSCLITFGQPRVGKRDWADLHDELIPTFRKLRFVYKSDLVTSIPQRLYGWAHHSRAVYMGSSKIIKLGRKRRFIDSSPYWQVCHDQEDFSCTHDITVIPSPSHHSMTKYFNAILDPPNKYRTKAGSQTSNFEDMLLIACGQPQSYSGTSSGMTLSAPFYSLMFILCTLSHVLALF